MQIISRKRKKIVVNKKYLGVTTEKAASEHKLQNIDTDDKFKLILPSIKKFRCSSSRLHRLFCNKCISVCLI